MPWTPEERKDWWKRFYEKSKLVNQRIDEEDAPLFAAQWSSWQGEEQEEQDAYEEEIT